MARQVQSYKCPACNLQVRTDNPTFPYCRYHQHLGNPQSSMVNNNTSYNFKTIRDIVYRPEKTKKKVKDMTVDLLSNKMSGNKLSKKSISTIVSAVSMLTKDIDIKEVARQADLENKIISSMKNTMEKIMSRESGYDQPHVFIAECENPSVYLPDGGTEILPRNHPIVCTSSKNNPTLVVDPLPSTPLYQTYGNGYQLTDEDRNMFASGKNTFMDGIVISSLYEYASYSSLNMSSINNKETGENIWFHPVSLRGNNHDIDAQRDTLKNAPQPVFPTVVHKVSPDPWKRDDDSAHHDKNQYDDDLDRLFAEDL